MANVARAALHNNQDAIYIITSIVGLNAEQAIEFYTRRAVIEEFFRASKQTLGLGACPARRANSQRNHIHYVLCAYVQSECRREMSHQSAYEQRAELFRGITRAEMEALA
jgi:hypothetical protein